MNRRALSLTLLSALLACGYTVAAEPKDEARTTAAAWLKALDAADYSSSWKTASEGFKEVVSSDAWNQTAKAVRAPLGQVKTRAERSATFTRSLPGAPDGEYVVIQFNTVFENKAQSVETITAKHDPDGNWRIAGYFIK
jgi:hypothetical protein